MTVVVFGIDALDPELVDPEEHPNLSLARFEAVDTIVSHVGRPSTHELWPSIITGLPPQEHGLLLDDGVAWENPLLRLGSDLANYVFPQPVQTKLGAWLLNNTSEDAFRAPASYYEENGLSTIFDGYESRAIGVPNYVVDPESIDREHQLRRSLGELFQRDPGEKGGHTSADVREFYELCMEMVLVRTARIRSALRSRRYELVFGYTSGLDLIGHVSHDRPAVQRQAYGNIDQFVGELVAELDDDDVLLLVSDHGLQDGMHTDEAMVATTQEQLLDDIGGLLAVRGAIESELTRRRHTLPGKTFDKDESDDGEAGAVVQQLEELGYL
jgi:hypothetical protein